MSTTYNPYKAPKTEITEAEFVPQEVELATIFERVLARVIDYLVFNLVVVVLVGIILSIYVIGFGIEEVGRRVDEMLEADDFSLIRLNLIDPSIWGAIILTHAIFLAIHGFLINRYGQTMGKRLLKIAIVDADTYEKVPLPRLFVFRYLIWSIPALSFDLINWTIRVLDLCFGLRQNRRTLHDMTANTIVIKVHRVAFPNAPTLDRLARAAQNRGTRKLVS